MWLATDDRQARVLLGPAKTVVSAGTTRSMSDGTGAIDSLALLGLGIDAPHLAALPPSDPGQLAAVLDHTEQAVTAVEVLAVMALVDGTLDSARIGQVLGFAQALGVHDAWLDDLVMSLDADLDPVIADMGDRNLEGITDGQIDLSAVDDVNHRLERYGGDGQDEQLAQRYRALAGLPPGTLGHESWSYYDHHHFEFPGQPEAANEIFGTPHDCAHLISGYDTTPQGELLVSTFTSRMHPVFPMVGHVLPVIYSWRLGIEFNRLAGSYRDALGPRQVLGGVGSRPVDHRRHLRARVRSLGARRGLPRVKSDDVQCGPARSRSRRQRPGSGGRRRLPAHRLMKISSIWDVEWSKRSR